MLPSTAIKQKKYIQKLLLTLTFKRHWPKRQFLRIRNTQSSFLFLTKKQTSNGWNHLKTKKQKPLKNPTEVFDFFHNKTQRDDRTTNQRLWEQRIANRRLKIEQRPTTQAHNPETYADHNPKSQTHNPETYAHADHNRKSQTHNQTHTDRQLWDRTERREQTKGGKKKSSEGDQWW